MALISGSLAAGPAPGATVVINNGFAPPNPVNVVDGEFVGDDVYVQNVGCDLTVQDPCASPGGPTTVTFLGGGLPTSPDAPQAVHARETSTAIFDGAAQGFGPASVFVIEDSASGILSAGFTMNASVHDQATLVLEGGSSGTMTATGQSNLVVNGGTHGIGFGVTAIVVRDNAVITIQGSNFQVNGGPVPYGPIGATTGVITGDLALGGSLSSLPTATFTRLDDGQIVLVPGASLPALGASLRAVLAIGLLGYGVVSARRMRGRGAGFQPTR
jgi:hypothetical protein